MEKLQNLQNLQGLDIEGTAGTARIGRKERAERVEGVVESIVFERVNDVRELGVFVDDELAAQCLEEAAEGYNLEHPISDLPEGAISEFAGMTCLALRQFSLGLLETFLRTF